MEDLIALVTGQFFLSRSSGHTFSPDVQKEVATTFCCVTLSSIRLGKDQLWQNKERKKGHISQLSRDCVRRFCFLTGALLCFCFPDLLANAKENPQNIKEFVTL